MSAPIANIDPVSPLTQLPGLQAAPPIAAPTQPVSMSFPQMLANGIDAVNDKAVAAGDMVRAFALDDSIPVHQVTFALTQAQLSVELMTQVRNRLVEGYQQLMNMQL